MTADFGLADGEKVLVEPSSAPKPQVVARAGIVASRAPWPAPRWPLGYPRRPLAWSTTPLVPPDVLERVHVLPETP